VHAGDDPDDVIQVGEETTYDLMLGHDEAQEVIGGQPPAATGGFGIGHTHQHEHSREQLHGLNRIAIMDEVLLGAGDVRRSDYRQQSMGFSAKHFRVIAVIDTS
jgi:hypothetical protein